MFGIAGFFLALSGLHDAGAKYNNFLLVIAYWIGPWLGVFFADQFLRRGKRVDGFLFDRKHNPWAGFAAMAIAMAVSIYLFANQTDYVGVVPKHHPALRRPHVRGRLRAGRAALRAVLQAAGRPQPRRGTRDPGRAAGRAGYGGLAGERAANRLTRAVAGGTVSA